MKTILFVYRSQQRPTLYTQVNILVSDDDQILNISFAGKGLYGHDEFDIDDEFIQSVYECMDESGPDVRYVAPKFTGQGYSIRINGTNIYHKMHKGQSDLGPASYDSVTDKSDYTPNLTAVLSNFLIRNKNKITASDQHKPELEKLTGLSLSTQQDTELLGKVKAAINPPLARYQQNGKRFFLFAKNENRESMINALASRIMTQAYSSDRSRLIGNGLEIIIREIIDTREKVKAHHRSGSIAGMMGITQSRLAQELQTCLKNLTETVDGAKNLIEKYEAVVKEQPKTVDRKPIQI